MAQCSVLMVLLFSAVRGPEWAGWWASRPGLACTSQRSPPVTGAAACAFMLAHGSCPGVEKCPLDQVGRTAGMRHRILAWRACISECDGRLSSELWLWKEGSLVETKRYLFSGHNFTESFNILELPNLVCMLVKRQ